LAQSDKLVVTDGVQDGARRDTNGALLLGGALQLARIHIPENQRAAAHKRQLVLDFGVQEAQTLLVIFEQLTASAADALHPVRAEMHAIAAQLTAGVNAAFDKHQQDGCSVADQTVLFTATELEFKSLILALTSIADLETLCGTGYTIVYRFLHRYFLMVGGQSKTRLASELNRLASFKAWPHAGFKHAQPPTLARAGFYHEPGESALDSDRVLCYSCGVSLVCWEPADEPWKEYGATTPP